MEWSALIGEQLRMMATKIAQYIPNLLAGLLILIVGWILARVLMVTAVKILSFFNVDELSRRAGLTETLKRGGIKYTPTELIGVLIYWLVMLAVLVAALDALGLPIAATLLDRLVLYLPNVVVAALVLIFGFLLAGFLSGLVRTAATSAGIPRSEFLGTIVYYIIIIFAAVMSLEQLGVARAIVVSTFQIILGAISLAAALAFGLGGQEMARNILESIMPETRRERRRTRRQERLKSY